MDDKQKIKDVLVRYFARMIEYNVAKVHQAFRKDAKITGYIEEDKFHARVASEFADFIHRQPTWLMSDGNCPHCDLVFKYAKHACLV